MSLSVEMFQQQMAWLSEFAAVMPLDELLVDTGNDKGLKVSLTFDDGYRSLYSVVAPILRTYRFPATVYINTGWIAEETPKPSDPQLGHYPGEEFLLWKDVLELAEQRWTIGSHGSEHLDLTKLTGSEVDLQVSMSKKTIETRLARSCRHFAYTWGRHDETARSALKNTGYVYAVAAHHEVLSRSDDLFALPRMDVRKDYTMKDFQAVLSGAWDYLGILHRLKGCR